MRKYPAALCLAALAWLLLVPSAASAAFESYLAVKGTKQGKGKATQSQQSVTRPPQASPKSMQRREYRVSNPEGPMRVIVDDLAAQNGFEVHCSQQHYSDMGSARDLLVDVEAAAHRGPPGTS